MYTVEELKQKCCSCITRSTAAGHKNLEDVGESLETHAHQQLAPAFVAAEYITVNGTFTKSNAYMTFL